MAKGTDPGFEKVAEEVAMSQAEVEEMQNRLAYNFALMATTRWLAPPLVRGVAQAP